LGRSTHEHRSDRFVASANRRYVSTLAITMRASMVSSSMPTSETRTCCSSRAEREFYDPAVIRRQLEEVGRLRDEGLMSDEEADAIEDGLVGRLMIDRGRGVGTEPR
jgi:hypothetical protein